MTMVVGARATFCAGHRLPQHQEVHGHSYEVWGYARDGRDVEVLQRDLAAACRLLDHRMLNEIIPDPTMEAIARFVAARVDGLARVVVARPVEGFACEYDGDADAGPARRPAARAGTVLEEAAGGDEYAGA